MTTTEKTLATATSIKAVQTPGVVTITAEGHKPSLQFDVALEQSPESTSPPEFILALNPTSDPDPMPVTLFIATATFGAHDPIEHVVVVDAQGRQEVKVEQSLD
jgi:hypothetical protein